LLLIEKLAQKPMSSEWIRGAAYYRNQRVHDLSAQQIGPDHRFVQGTVHAAAHYAGRLTLCDGNRQLSDWQCSCRQDRPNPCRHIIAILLGDRLTDQTEKTGLLVQADEQQNTAVIDAQPFKTDVHILFRYEKQTDQLLVFPRITVRNRSGQKLLSLNPCDPEDRIQNSRITGQTKGLRDKRLERSVIDFFAAWVDDRRGPVGCLTFAANNDLSFLVNKVLPGIPPQWHILYDSDLEKMLPQRKAVKIDFSRLKKRSAGLFAFNLSFHCDQLDISLDQLAAYIKGQQKWLLLNGQFIEATNKEQLSRLLEYLMHMQRGDPDGDEFVTNSGLSADLVLAADQTDQTAKTGSVHFDDSFRTLLNGLQKEDLIQKLDIPDTVSKLLRPYQKQGVQWLCFLKQYSLGGILADDMGLGKTLQVLTALAVNRNNRPALIVCPKTLVYNWHREARRFTPDLKVTVIQGDQATRRYLLRQAADCDLVITSYGLLQRDLASYLALTYTCCVLDEAQVIKNPDTHLARNVKQIRAEQRLALSGTPMENDLEDLWSIFDFVLPGYLGNRNVFRAQYAEANREQLLRRIKPFLLRRTKADVLPELPAKTEETIYTALTQNQLALYQQTLISVRQSISAASDLGIAQTRIAILAGLTRLRQICIHPGLVHSQYRNASGVSGKLRLFDELLQNCLANRHRVLVFSQFTQMLSILVHYLENQSITYCYLDGRTRDRTTEIDRFNRQSDIPVFLISLKAGGFGLNLTAADTVILFDPWWNPMVEDQAADRVHRIGQTKAVTVYRLIAQGTIEERIERLQESKRLDFDQIINSTAHNDRQSLSLADLQALLEADDPR